MSICSLDSLVLPISVFIFNKNNNDTSHLKSPKNQKRRAALGLVKSHFHCKKSRMSSVAVVIGA